MHQARKRFGQHFLSDEGVIQELIRLIHPTRTQSIVEIGPGLGALTIPLLKIVHHVDAIELDYDLIPLLEKKCISLGDLCIHAADALVFDYSTLASQNKLRVVGNLPYNISTPLIFHLLTYAPIIKDMFFMLQKEVVDRIVAKPGDKHYGRLSIMVQYHCEATGLFTISPASFTPPPKVQSRIVKLVPHSTLPNPANDYPLFANIVSTAFMHRRKMLHNALKELFPVENWEAAKKLIPAAIRPEELSVKEYVQLSHDLSPYCKKNQDG